MNGKPRESGFALLLVFAMAAIIAITMYVALPRIAFESERDKEQLLISRGEQYSRAIQLYVRKTKRFPGKIEDLENTNGIRFLRKQYVDPMTGKSEWRIIHAGPGGTLIDSLVHKQTQKKDGPVADNFITELNPTNNSQTDAPTNPALRKRPSDQAGAPGSPTAGGAIPSDPTTATNAGTGINAIPQTPGPTAASPNLPGRSGPVTTPNQATATASGGISTLPMFGGAAPTGNPTPTTPQTGVPGQLPPAVQQQITNPNGQLPAGAPNNASALIQGLLTTPRPGGLAGLQAGAAQAGQQGQIVGGGIAGIASNHKGLGIKIYHDQDEFPKWEFVYDVAKDVTMNPAAALPPAAAAPGTPIGGASATGAATTPPGATTTPPPTTTVTPPQ